jgi:hypothetical protein
MNCPILGYYAASSGIILFLTPEDGTDGLSRNMGKTLPLPTAYHPRKVQFSSDKACAYRMLNRTFIYETLILCLKCITVPIYLNSNHSNSDCFH